MGDAVSKEGKGSIEFINLSIPALITEYVTKLITLHFCISPGLRDYLLFRTDNTRVKCLHYSAALKKEMEYEEKVSCVWCCLFPLYQYRVQEAGSMAKHQWRCVAKTALEWSIIHKLFMIIRHALKFSIHCSWTFRILNRYAHYPSKDPARPGFKLPWNALIFLTLLWGWSNRMRWKERERLRASQAADRQTDRQTDME